MRTRTLVSDLAPYIAGAAVITFALDYFAQPLGTGLSASGPTSFQTEAMKPMSIIDRSKKGDRLPGAYRSYGHSASGTSDIAIFEPRSEKAGVSDALRSPKFELKIPDGCESAFSSLSLAEQQKLATRCLT